MKQLHGKKIAFSHFFSSIGLPVCMAKASFNIHGADQKVKISIEVSFRA